MTEKQFCIFHAGKKVHVATVTCRMAKLFGYAQKRTIVRGLLRAQWGPPCEGAGCHSAPQKTRFRECASFVHVNAVLMCKLFLRSKTVKTSWIRRNPVGPLETGPSPWSYLACEEIHEPSGTICGFFRALTSC